MNPLSAALSALFSTVPGRLMLIVCVWLGVSVMAGGGSAMNGIAGLGSADNQKVTVHERADHVLIRWSGSIDKSTPRALDRVIRQRYSDPRRIVLSLNSNGGMVSEGEVVIERIKQLRRTHTVDTLVEDGGQCASMCVPIFAAGGHRMAHPNARFMFHSVRMASTSVFFRPSREQVRHIEERATEDLFDDHLRASGINERWLDSLRTTMGSADVWFNARELYEQRVGIVDELAPARAR
jgi:ATP-dependent protease ClpP protease subunit